MQEINNMDLRFENEKIDNGVMPIRNTGTLFPGIISFCIATIGILFMARPFVRFMSKLSNN